MSENAQIDTDAPESTSEESTSEESTPTAPPAPPYEAILSPDKLTLYVSVPDPLADLDAAAMHLATEISILELADAPDTDTLAELLRDACQLGKHLVKYPLLEGRQPVPPRHPELEWCGDFFVDGFAIDEKNDRADYWERVENLAVIKDQELAILLLPREGEPGLDLRGDEVPVPKPKELRVNAGKGVRAEEHEDTISYLADASGRLTHKDGTIGVDEVFTVKGDVSIETGNVRHPGAVVVGGDIREGATLEVGGDLVVRGMMEPADVTCGGDLTVGGGILGDPEHHLEVDGGVQARYLNEVSLRCGGDVTVTNEIVHSRVETRGQVRIPRGRIAGGLTRAYLGIELAQAGSPGATGTTIILGSDWRFELQRVAHHERLEKLQLARDKLAESIATATERGALQDERFEIVARLQSKLTTIDAALKTEADRYAQAVAAVEATTPKEMAVLAATWPDVTFHIGDRKTTSIRHDDSPRLVTIRRGEVRILPMGEDNTPESE